MLLGCTHIRNKHKENSVVSCCLTESVRHTIPVTNNTACITTATHHLHIPLGHRLTQDRLVRKRAELDHHSKRLATLATVRPPHMAEQEALQGQLQEMYLDYASRLLWENAGKGLCASCVTRCCCTMFHECMSSVVTVAADDHPEQETYMLPNPNNTQTIDQVSQFAVSPCRAGPAA